MPTITDEQIQKWLSEVKQFSAVILRKPRPLDDAAMKIIREHARRNLMLNLEGKVPIICPTADSSEFAGLLIFRTGLEETRETMNADPAVQAGLLSYELHLCRGLPGAAL